MKSNTESKREIPDSNNPVLHLSHECFSRIFFAEYPTAYAKFDSSVKVKTSTFSSKSNSWGSWMSLLSRPACTILFAWGLTDEKTSDKRDWWKESASQFPVEFEETEKLLNVACL